MTKKSTGEGTPPGSAEGEPNEPTSQERVSSVLAQTNVAVFTEGVIESVLEHMDQLVVQLDAVGRVVHLSRDEFGIRVGKPIFDCLSREHAETLRTHLDLARAGPQTYTHAWDLRGDTWVLVRVLPMERAGGGHVLLLCDISARRRSELQTESFKSQLRQQQKLEAIGSLASGVAHEISNPIQGIMNYAELIQETSPHASSVIDFAGEITRETERVSMIVRNLLDFARNERQNHSPADIVDIVRSTCSLLHSVLMRSQIQLELDLPDDLPRVKCRSQQIQQVLLNLLNNAREALDARFPQYDPEKRLLIQAEQFSEAGAGWVRIRVRDRGIGFESERLSELFEPFVTTKSRDEHTGLGLSVSRSIIDDHHGQLHLRSDARGTVAEIELRVNNGWSLKSS